MPQREVTIEDRAKYPVFALTALLCITGSVAGGTYLLRNGIHIQELDLNPSVEVGISVIGGYVGFIAVALALIAVHRIYTKAREVSE